jgi:hypothetical protein
LVDQGYLGRIQRLVGGDHGGSGQYVYQLGRASWKLLDKPGAYWAPRAVNLHALAVADCYAVLKRAECDGEIEVIQFTTEPDCHQAVGDVLLAPDAYVEVGDRIEQVKYALWLEVDRGTEHLNVIREKCERYWRAYQVWQGDYFPVVLFIAPDNRRADDLRRVMANAPKEVSRLFRFSVSSNLTGEVVMKVN